MRNTYSQFRLNNDIIMLEGGRELTSEYVSVDSKLYM